MSSQDPSGVGGADTVHLLCETCGEREAAGVDEFGDAECAPCAMRWQLAQAAKAEVTARITAALDHGRRVGLDDQRLAWAVGEATRNYALEGIDS
jgi:hypothetical protein